LLEDDCGIEQPLSGAEVEITFAWLEHASIAALVAIQANVLG